MAVPARLRGALTRERVVVGGGALLAEALLVVGYFGTTGAEPTALRYVIYPFVWINLGAWATWRVRPPAAGPRVRRAAAAVAVTYFLVLAYATGLLALYPGIHEHVSPFALSGATAASLLPALDWLAVPLHAGAANPGLSVTLASPGWGPRVAYVLPEVGHAYFVPYRVVGYLALSYLVYASALEAARAALSGVVGLGACLSCSFPIVGSLAAGVTGWSATLAAVVYAYSVDLSTAVFLLAVGLLLWRPRGVSRA